MLETIIATVITTILMTGCLYILVGCILCLAHYAILSAGCRLEKNGACAGAIEHREWLSQQPTACILQVFLLEWPNVMKYTRKHIIKKLNNE